MKKIFTFLFVAFFCLCGGQASWGQVYVHNFGTSTISAHPYTVAPTTFASNLSASSWSNSASAWTSFAGSAGQAITLGNSSGTPTITLTFNVAAGFQLEVTSYSFWRQRSTTGAQNWSMTINGNAVGSGTAPTTGTGTGNITTNLPLSNLTGTITVVISLSGATGTGNFRLDDFTLNGSVTSTSTPNIALSSPNPAVAVGNIAQCSTNNPIYRFDLGVTMASATLNGVTINTTGTYTATDITNFKCWYSADATFNAVSDVLLSTKTATLGTGSHVFPSFTSQVINSGATGYIFITADIPAGATASNTLTVSAITTGDISFVAGNKSGTANAGGAQTITSSGITEATAVSATAGNAQATVAWTNPTCAQEIMIVAKQGSFTSASPTGDGSAYTANLAYGSGTAFDGGFVVYKGSVSSQVITALTNCLAYEFKIFARKGTTWSTGVTASTTPTSTASSLSDVVGVASSEANTISSLMNTATISTSTDGVQVWQITIRDGGSGLNDADCLPTIVNSIVLTQGAGNAVTNWNNIQSIAIFNGTTLLANGTVATSSVTFSGAPLISVPDNGSVTLSIRMSLKATLTIPSTGDGLDFVFGLTSANFTTASSATSSQKATATFPVISTDTKNAIEVIATKLAFIVQPSNTTVGAVMTSPTVEAEDANGNRDRDYVTNINIVSTGSLDVTPKTATPPSGLATFSNIVHTISGTGLTLTASSGSLTNVVSNTFNISVLINSETFGTCGSLTWTPYDVTGDNVWTCGAGYMEMNGFGGTTDQDWLISPALNLSLYANEVLTFRNAKDFTGPDLQLVYSTDYDGVSNPSTNGTWTTLTFTKATNTTFGSSGNVDLSAIVGSSVYLAFRYTATGTGAGQAALWRVDDISITGNITSATLVASPTSRTGFSYAQGAGPSASQSFNLSGVNLTPSADNITLVPPTNYEISTDNASFTSSNILIAYTGGALASTPIYIRLKAGLTVGNYNGELINVSGGGASAIDVSCSGNVFIMPQIALSSSNPSIVASNITQNTTNNVIYKFELAVTDADATLTNISFTTAGTYTTSDLSNIKLWYSPDATFAGSGNDVLLRTKTTTLKTNPQTFTAFSQTITAGSVGYFFLTTDLTCSVVGRTFSVNALTTSDITVTLGNKTGTAFASDAQTVISTTPVNVTAQATSACTNGGTTVSWTAPAGCSDNVLVFATAGTFTATLPTGNGGAYTANTAFGSGTAFDGGFCVFKGTTATVNVTGLTNGTTYTYKIFTRNGTNWSSGVTTSCVPTLAYCASSGNTSFQTGVTSVTFNTLTNADGTAKDVGYELFGATTTVLQNSSYTLTTLVNTAGNFTVYTKAWVDWNQDADFADAGEEYDLGTAVNVTNGITTLSPLSITVPLTATLGTTRMRVATRYNAAPTACLASFDGEVEDYNITVAAACTPTHSITSFAPTSGSLGTWVTINGTGFTGSSTVKFGSVTATSVIYESTTKIYAQMPITGATSTITVTEASCAVTTGTSFTVTSTSGVCSSGNFTDIFISEVYDADAGNTLYVELYNPTASAIDLTTNAYKIKIDNRAVSDAGVSIDRTITLTGTIPANSVFLVNIGTALTTCSNTWGFTESGPGINEADYIFLEKSGADVDRANFPNETGYTYKRLTTATAPTATYSAGDWDISLTESCTDLGSFIISNPPIVSTITDASTCSLIDMSITATAGNGGVLTYKWFYNDRVATGWTEVNTTNLPDFTLTGQASNNLKIADNVQLVSSIANYQFYCEVTENATCVKISNASPFSTSSRPVYRSKAGTSGSWTTTAVWEMANTTAGPWINACTHPISTNSTEVIIQTGTNITLSIDLAIDKVTIENGGTLEVATNAQLDLSNENAGADLIVNGTFYYRSNSSNTMGFATGSTWSIASNGTLIKTNTSSAANLRDNYEGGISTIPATADFIFRYNGDGNVSVTTVGMFYPNLTFESTAGFWDGFTTASSFVGSSGGFATVKGNLDIGGTGSGTVKIYNENFNTQPMLILGNLAVRAGSTLTNDGITDLGASDSKGRGFEIRGNLVVNGTLTVNATDVNVTSPILKFSGTAGEQTIAGTGTLNIHELDVNKTSAFDLKLLRSITVGNLVDLQVGDINLNGFNIDMGTTATLNENVASDYLVKDLTATTEASVGGYIRFSNRNINNTQTSIGGSRLWLNWTAGADYTVNFDRYHYSANGKAIKLIYRVAVNSGTMGATNLRISYADYELFTLSETLNVARWANGAGWSSYIADVSDASANYSQRNGITAFSHWTLTDTNVLLASPEADLKATQVGKQTSLVQWANAPVGKTILQKSLDGLTFQDLAEAEQAFTDNDFRQDAYYRLQTTHNGQTQYSKAVFLRHEAGEGIYLYPNPYKQGGQARLYVGDKTLQSLHILDVQGRIVGKTSENALTYDLDNLPAGTYILKALTDKGVHYIRFVKL